MVELTESPIDPAAVIEKVRSNLAGAICTFFGTVREVTGGRVTSSLDYEAYPEMALKGMQDLEAEARLRWPVIEVAIIHRVGHHDLGEISVAVAVSTPHRRPSFEACQWIIDTLKEVVPIWKKEVWADGTEEWVHPGGGREDAGERGAGVSSNPTDPLTWQRNVTSLTPNEPKRLSGDGICRIKYDVRDDNAAVYSQMPRGMPR